MGVSGKQNRHSPHYPEGLSLVNIQVHPATAEAVPAPAEFTTTALCRPAHDGGPALAVKAGLQQEAQNCTAEMHIELLSSVPVAFPQAQRSKVQAQTLLTLLKTPSV